MLPNHGKRNRDSEPTDKLGIGLCPGCRAYNQAGAICLGGVAIVLVHGSGQIFG